MLNRLDAHRIVIHIQGAGGLTRCGTNSTRELREVVRAVQDIDRVLPIALKDQFVEIRNDVVNRTTAITKRRTTVHAPRRLLLCAYVIQPNDKLFVVFQTLFCGQVALFKTLKFHETRNFSHAVLLMVSTA